MSKLNELIEEMGTEPEVMTEAVGRRPFSDYVLNAEAAFLEHVAKQIKKIAGPRAEKVYVNKGVSAVWLEYHGQDRSDIDMEFAMHVMSIGEHKVKLFWRGKTINGRFDKDSVFTSGQLTPVVAADVFKEHFGR